ncbi:hypothetical protein B484DRAFT_439897, partial [Ochromonadaceae sp. CCMP2298]
MPGPERLATEGVLMGAVPIVSSRWVGASAVDYPGVRRVDHFNSTDISQVLAEVAGNYQNELKSAQKSAESQSQSQSKKGHFHSQNGPFSSLNEPFSSQNGLFFAYAVSLWRKVQDTADLLLGSSRLHFVIAARDLQEEYVGAFQLLALLFLHPLSSVDLYVPDVHWFMRHHYPLFEALQLA